MSAIKRAKKRKRERGIALILVVGALTVLTVFLTELQEETMSEVASATAERDTVKAEYYARSAINLSRMLIAIEPKVRAAVAPMFLLLNGGKGKPPQIPVWEFTDLVLGVFNDPSQGGIAFGGIGLDPAAQKNLGLSGGGHFELTIVDEDSKLNLNTASRGSPVDDDKVGAQLMGLIAGQQYNEMFEGRDPDGQFSDRQTVCSALVDWADPDENAYACDLKASGPTNSGGEDNIYQSLGLGYKRKNAAFDSLEEVHMVRGVSDDFWSTFVDPDPSDPHKRAVTVWGQGAVNVNNANAQTLLAILCSPNVLKDDNKLCKDPEQAASFLLGVSLAKSFTQGAPLFGSAQDFMNAMAGKPPLGDMLKSLKVDPVEFKAPGEFKKAVSTESKIFSIYADGILPGYRRKTRVRIHSVVDFRGAAAIGQQTSTIAGGTPQGTTGTTPTPPAGTPGSSATQTSANGTQLPATPGPGGTVIYWRVE